MENIRKNYCGLIDGKLGEIIDSTDENDRIRAAYLMLTANVSDELLKSRRENPEAEERILLLGKAEVSAIKEYKQQALEDYQEERRNTEDELDLPAYEETDLVANNLWGIAIYTIDLPSFIGIATGPGFYIFDEDFNVETEISDAVKTSAKYNYKLLKEKQHGK